MQQSQIKQMAVILKRHGVALAYLYGSHARANAGPLSDVDIAVLFAEHASDTQADLTRYSALRHDLAGILGNTIDLVDMESARSPLLLHRIVYQGKLMYSRSTELRRHFEQRVLHEYEDTRYLRALQARIMHQQILAGQ